MLPAGDIQLDDDDVGTLRPGQWLNDQVIAYQFERLQQCRQGALQVLEPSLSFTASIVDAATLHEMLCVPRTRNTTPLSKVLADAELVLIPVNNNTDADMPNGGSHWSLLVFRRQIKGDGGCRFEHYDSCTGANNSLARNIAGKLVHTLAPKSKGTIRVVHMRTPQQVNGFDCGMYVLAIGAILCKAFDAGNKSSVSLDLEAVSPRFIESERKALFNELIQCLTLQG